MKFWNYSHQGVAPDAIYVNSQIQDKFISEFKKQVKSQYSIHTNTSVLFAPSTLSAVVLAEPELHRIGATGAGILSKEEFRLA